MAFTSTGKVSALLPQHCEREKTYLLPVHECSIFPEETHSVKNSRSTIMAKPKVIFSSILQSPTAKDHKQTYREKEGRWEVAPQPWILLCGKLTLENLSQWQRCLECTAPLQPASDPVEGFQCTIIKLNVFQACFNIK